MINYLKIDKRNINVDLIRSIAVFSVVAVHFFLNTSFYSQPLTGKLMAIQTIMRTSFMICVPLFLMLSGYLMNKKEISKKYYLGLSKTIIIYLIASLICLLYNYVFMDLSYSLTEIIQGIFNFKFASYSWYINMYIGLYLIIPFLNIVWRNDTSKKYYQLIIVILLILTTLPTITTINLFPNWWMGGLYPLTYYFIGAYIKEHDISIKWYTSLILFLFFVCLFGLYNFYSANGGEFKNNSSVDWMSYQNVINTVLSFITILHLPLNKIPLQIKYLIYKISECSLGLYLISSIVDSIIYPRFNILIPLVRMRITYFILVVPLVFICSMICSIIIMWTYTIICSIYKVIINKVTL